MSKDIGLSRSIGWELMVDESLCPVHLNPSFHPVNRWSTGLSCVCTVQLLSSRVHFIFYIQSHNTHFPEMAQQSVQLAVLCILWGKEVLVQ